MGLHIAGGTGVGIITPGTSNPVGFFQQGQVIEAGQFQFDGHAQTTKTATDNQNGRVFSQAGLAHDHMSGVIIVVFPLQYTDVSQPYG